MANIFQKDGTIDMKLVQFKEYCSEKRVKTGGFISAELDLKYEKEALEYCKKHLKPHKKA